MIAYEPNERFDFILEEDRALTETDPPVFTLQVMDHKTSKEGNRLFNSGRREEAQDLVINKCLMGWRGFKNRRGQDVSFERTPEGLTETTLNRMPGALVAELVTAVLTYATVSEDERKNWSSPVERSPATSEVSHA